MILEKAKTTKSVSFNGRGFERKKSLDQTEKLEIVDLSGLFLESLPKASLNLGFISMLDLSNNNLQIIPESMVARLLNVVVLDVHSNQLRLLPNSIGCLSKLKVLNVSGNLIESLPKTIENCRSLEELNANFNKLEKLPDTIGFELSNLRKLSVNSNKLAFLPHSLTHMTSLRILDVRLNCLHSLPEDLENLINLEVLNVSQNFQCLETLPYSIGLLLSLVELDASYNKISALPASVGCLHKLKKLSMEGNPLVFPPPELLEKGLNAVREYMSERMNEAPTHKKWWAVKLFKFGTFNGRHSSSMQRDKKRFSFNKPEYCSINSLASPRHLDRMGMFSPGRLIFSPLSYFSR